MKKLLPGMRRARKGFSLLEVLFTVLILAILAAVAVPLYTSTKTSSAASACKSNIQALANAESKYRFDNGSYTGTAASLVTEGIAMVPTCPLATGTATDTYALTVTGTGSTATVLIHCPNHSANDVTLSGG